MYLSLTTTHQPATDLGYLLGKHPERYQTRELSFGMAHLFFPEARAERCRVVLYLEVNPIKEMRKGDRTLPGQFSLEQYVNDRPYATSSLLSTAIAKVLGSALNGNCKERPELVDEALPLEIELASVSVRGTEQLLHDLFEPLGYTVEYDRPLLDEHFPDWGESPYYRLRLRHELPLKEALAHLYVLLPALDNRKHYFIGEAEREKLLAKGDAWLARHPVRERIVKRFLRHRSELSRGALQQLEEQRAPEESFDEAPANEMVEVAFERRTNLHALRHDRVAQELVDLGATSVVDLGCGSGKLMRKLLTLGQLDRITGMDTSIRALEVAKKRLNWDRLSPRQRDRLELIQGALTYRDQRLEGYDAAVLVEVIEHIDPARLSAVERVVFRYAQPRVVIVTTPNREYNQLFPTLPPGQLRHVDHRFEWTRSEFADWAGRVATTFGFTHRLEGIGEADPQHGAPSQMAVFIQQT